jgi:multiple antibiotic resistance protein
LDKVHSKILIIQKATKSPPNFYIRYLLILEISSSIIKLFSDFTIYFLQILRIPDTFPSDIITTVIALFVVIDPIGNIPLFITLTKKLEKEEQKTISKTAILTTGILLVIFGVAGTQILQLFGITIFSFMIAGGILLFIIAIELLTYGE